MNTVLEQRIEILPEKRLIGKSMTMTFSANTTHELWRSFILRRKEVQHAVGFNLYSIQQYAPGFFAHINPDSSFKKWAAVEVSEVGAIPEDMEEIHIEAGMYAVFDYKGDVSNAAHTFQYILGVWLPQSIYVLDDRLHFEILKEKYKNGDPDSEEEIWIPIRDK